MQEDGASTQTEQSPDVARSSGRWLPWIGGAVVAAILATVLVLATRPDESADASAGDGAQVVRNGLVVTLTRTGGGSVPAAVGVPVSLDVGVTGRSPVGRLELWDGDRLVGTSEVDDGLTSIRRTVSWTPEETGDALLLARALDDEGRTAQSNALPLTVVPVASPAVRTTVTATEGDSITSIAETAGLDPAYLAATNPGVPPEGPIPAGTEVDVPLVDPVGMGDAPEPPGSSETPAAESGVPDAIPLDPPSEDGGAAGAGRAPTVRVAETSDPCAPRVAVEGDADAFTVQALQPGARAFVPVADVAASGGTAQWQPTFGPGTHVVVAGVRTDVGQALGAPVEVTIPDECAGEWSGDVRLVQGMLTGGEPADTAYAYLSTDGGAWVRVPAADDATVPFDGTGFDLSAFLPPLEGSRLDVDAWGWRDGALVHIGTGAFVPRDGVPLSQVVGAPATATLDIVVADPGGPDEQLAKEARLPEPGVIGLRWSASMPGVTHGLWQVTWLPPDPDDWLDPTGLVAQGTVSGGGSLFGIDTAGFADVPMTLTLGTVAPDYASVVADPVVAEEATTSTTSTAGAPIGGAVMAPNVVSGTAGLTVPVDEVPLPSPNRYWIRIVPMIGDQAAGVVTNTVSVDLTPPPPAETDPNARDYLAEATVSPPAPPDFRYSSCVQLNGWDADEVLQPSFDTAMANLGKSWPPPPKVQFDKFGYWYWTYQSIVDRFGQDIPICAGGCYGPIPLGNCASSSVLEDFGGALVGGIVTLWDEGVVKAFNYVKGKAVEVLATFSGCEAIAGAVAGEDGEDACEVMAEAAVDAALISVGIPPNLPTTGEIIASAKGDLKVALVQLAEAYGVPCDDLDTVKDQTGKGITCDEVSDELVEGLEDALEEAFRKQTESTVGLYFPPGANVVPHPRGQITPATVDLTLTPNRENAAGITARECQVTASLHSTWQTPDPVLGIGDVVVDVPGTTGQIRSGGFVQQVLVAPQTFSNFSFEFAERTIVADPQQPVSTRIYLYRPSLLFPVPVTYWVANRMQGFEQLPDIGVPDWLPRTSFLLQPGAVHDVTILDPCSGITTVEVDTGGPGPQA